MIRRPPLRIRRDERGVTIVEFGFVAPVLVLTLIGLFDLGYNLYVSSVMQGALHEAARMATVGDKTPSQIDNHVKERLTDFHPDATIVTDQKSYYDYAGVGKPEKITSDTVPLGEYNAGDCFEDSNGNGQYDLDRGKSGLGNSEDVVQFEVTMSYPAMFPLYKLIGGDQQQVMTASTLLRNQPYAARVSGTTIIC
ncbi:MAG: TadE/TadG family type IV pilus assembly protein [Sphingomonadaceae bacterium]